MNDQRELRFIEWLQDGPNAGPAEGPGAVFAVTRTTPQRPAWVGRMSATASDAWTATQWLPQTLGYVGIVILLLIALLVALVVGAPRPLPPPFGPARNGAIAYEVHGQIRALDLTTNLYRTLEGTDGLNHSPRFSHDGTRIAFWSDPGQGLSRPANRLFVATAGLRDVHDISGSTGYDVCYCWPPEWSPDDRQIVFQARDGEMPRLYIAPWDGSGDPVAITDNSIIRRDVQWSPSGEWLAFVRLVSDSPNDNASIGFVRVDGSDERFYDTQTQEGDATAYADGGVRWSPDSSRVAYTRGGENLAFATALVVAAPDGDVHQVLIENSGWLRHPRWSPDGTEIAVLAGERNTRLIVAAADSSERRTIPLPGQAIPDLVDAECALEWSPDGLSLVVRCTEVAAFVVTAAPPYGVDYLDIPIGSDTRLDWQRLAP